METSVALLLVFLLVLFVIQMFIDAAFMFVCYMTGVIALKIITFLNTKYQILSYSVFKETYKTHPTYKKPMAVGLVLWILIFIIIVF